MALDTWLIKMKKTIYDGFDSFRVTSSSKKRIVLKKSSVGVLAFEIAGIISKLLHLCQSLSGKNIHLLRRESICLEGVRKIVSNEDPFLLGLACAELVGNLRMVAQSVSRMSKKCSDSSLWCFDRLFDEFANTGHDPHNWILGSKEMKLKNKKFDGYVTLTALLRREMDELAVLENGLKTSFQSKKDHDSSIKFEQNIVELRHKINCLRQQVKHLKEKSLWCRSFDYITPLLIRYVFTILARIKFVFGVGKVLPPSLPRNLSGSALVYPSENMDTCEFESGSDLIPSRDGFFDMNFKIFKPPPGTLGASALALHYANVIIVLEKMIKSPQSIGIDARDNLYSMLPNSIRFGLRARLKGVGHLASDPSLAAEWRCALHKIMGWLWPLAHNMIKWQSDRCFEQQNLVPKNNLLLLQTLYFANLEKTEAAITELLIGLNYIWRFEKQSMKQ